MTTTKDTPRTVIFKAKDGRTWTETTTERLAKARITAGEAASAVLPAPDKEID